MMDEKWTWPSKKWVAARCVAVGTLATAFFEAGGQWSSTLSILATGIVVAGATAYLLPNGGEA
jgi:hypothetical protein